jgi:ArsR family transcriptional regulator
MQEHRMAEEERLFAFHADMCKMLSSPIRLKIIHFLRSKEKSVNELARECSVPQATLSQHLGLMRQRGMLITRKEGTTVYYRLSNPKMIEAFDLIREILSERLLEMQKLRRALSQ